MAELKYAANNKLFNAEAAAWDSSPTIHLASALALKTLQDNVENLQTPCVGTTKGLDLLEIGCGTGVLSFLISPYVRSVTGVDVAEGMIDVLKAKLAKPEAPRNILPVHAVLEDPDDARIQQDPLGENATDGVPRRFDLVISHLVLHHIPSLSEALSTMYGSLKPGGRVALTDYEDFGPEARKFHPEGKMDGVQRHGILREEMKILLKEAGFTDTKVETAFVLDKDVEVNPGEGVVKGVSLEFPFLICLGTKV